MKLPKTTLILLALALISGSAVLLYETQLHPKQEAAKAKSQRIVDFEEANVQSVLLKTPSQTLRFERTTLTEPKPEDPKWFLKEPEEGEANEANVAFLLSQVTTSSQVKSLTIKSSELKDFGLDQPQATIELTLKNQKQHRVVLGGADFNRTNLYAQVDPATPPSPEVKVLLVPIALESAVNRPLSDWKKPVVAATPSPSPSPSASPSPEAPSPSPETPTPSP